MEEKKQKGNLFFLWAQQDNAKASLTCLLDILDAWAAAAAEEEEEEKSEKCE